jgi:hypothetical protein
MRLFDGHSQCHSIPIELEGIAWGRSEEFVSGSEQAWDALHSDRIERHFSRGWRQGRVEPGKDARTYPFLLPPLLQRRIFDASLGEVREPDKRAVVNSYMTSYFNAWLDNQNLYGGDKAWITAFTPRLIDEGPTLGSINEIYPDGRIISMVRDPRSWYPSARLWSVEWRRLDVAIQAWIKGVEAIRSASDLLGDRMCVIVFDDLINRREKTMRGLTRFLGIRFTPNLLTPTLNRMRVWANSSFQRGSGGDQTTTRYRSILSKDEISRIEEMALGRYEEIREMARDEAKARKKQGSPGQSQPVTVERQDATEAGPETGVSTANVRSLRDARERGTRS